MRHLEMTQSAQISLGIGKQAKYDDDKPESRYDQEDKSDVVG